MPKKKPKYPFGAGPTSGLPIPGLPASGVFGVGPADIGPQRPPSPRPPDPLADYPRVPTIDELLAQANKLAGASLGGEQATLQTQRAQTAADAERRAAFQRDLAQALAQALGGVGPSIQGAYQEAARDQTTFAKGFSDGLRLLAERGAGESNQFLGGVGSPQTIPSRSEAGDVLYGLGGYIPGQTFEREGAAFGAAGMMLPATALGIGQRQATAEISAGAEEQKKIDAQIRVLAAKRQATFTDYLFKLQQQALGTQITRAEAKEQRRQFDLRQKAAENEAKAKAKADLLKEKSRTLLELAKLDQKAAALEETARYHDQIANDQTLNRGQRERAAEAAAAARAEANDIAREANDIRREQVRAKQKPKVDPVEVRRQQETARLTARTAFNGDPANLNEADEVDPIPRQTYQQAMELLLSDDVPLKAAQKALNRWWTPGRKFGDFSGEDTSNWPKRPDGKLYQKARIVDGFVLMPWERPGEGRPLKNFQQRSGGGLRTTQTRAPLPTPMSQGSEFAMPDAEGAPDRNGNRYHAGKDWFAPAGTAVVAPVPGRVVSVIPSAGTTGQVYGGVVKVRAADGKVWVFRHVVPRVARGQKVGGGDLIASVSEWSDGSPHAHVELWKTLRGGYKFENMLDPSVAFSGSGAERAPPDLPALDRGLPEGFEP